MEHEPETQSEGDEVQAQAKTPDQTRKNERSTIGFPYLDLETAVEVARSLYERAGLSPCDIDELAAEMKQTVSGSFRLKTSAAKMYGFIDKDGRSRFNLTELGERLVDASTERPARVEAFLNIPLFSAIFEKYRGKVLPSSKALEREMTALGVAHKQADKARQTFERAARQAGFFEQGDDRLVKPRVAHNPFNAEIAEQDDGGYSRDHDADSAGADSSSSPAVRIVKESAKPLEYLLIDLLKDEEIEEDEKAAVWTLVQYLTRKGAKA